MEFAKQWKGVNGYMIRDPDLFFDQYRERHGVGYPLAFMLVSFVVVVLPVMAIGTILNITSPMGALSVVVLSLGLALLFWLTTVIESLLAHAIASLFGTDRVVLTLEAYAFPTLIRYGLWWVPLVNIALGLYGLYLQIKGLAAFHSLSTGQAAIAAVVATLVAGFVVPTGGVLLVAVLAAFVLDLGETTTEPGPGPGQDPESFTFAVTHVLEYAPQVFV
ncbi:YIP1 family protein [Natrarchaeobaculum aegyptiacum]|uniref:Yip1 domain-containing protein n=1 Tax=Natrarchaeobaculum aegyptiacum TaxID=745377 RepID=A0A2Z2HVE0_9EURY|nr:YIP1 family protein [Natrarchaeobaculum aegyptiacum]ARS89497.1 hypothetical protein B1756_06875 [Natrarchaeobaculum aegyptiacum]